MPDTTETFAALLRRYRDADDNPGAVPRVSFAEAVRRGDDPLHVLPYMAGLGLTVRSIDDLLLINADAGEEDVHCFRVVEGIAVTISSECLWQLFLP